MWRLRLCVDHYGVKHFFKLMEVMLYYFMAEIVLGVSHRCFSHLAALLIITTLLVTCVAPNPRISIPHARSFVPFSSCRVLGSSSSVSARSSRPLFFLFDLFLKIFLCIFHRLMLNCSLILPED